MGVPVIEFKDLSFSYDHYNILESVSFEVLSHELVSIVGPNGGGKTTLLKLILGLLHPDAGTVRVFGKRPEQVRRRLGYMPQHAHLDPQFPITVMDVVLMGRLGNSRVVGPYGRRDREVAEQALREMLMWDFRRSHFSALSGGQRQRVLIARALACEPEMLLLDEPTAGLDLAVESELFEILGKLARNLTVVIVSHDLGFVSQFVTKVLCVKRKVVVHPTSEITGKVIHDLYGAAMRMVRHDKINSGDPFDCLCS